MRSVKKIFLTILTYIFIVPPAFIMSLFTKLKLRDLWLIYECGYYARDNGYWFFKYIREHHPEQNVIFVINKKSPDYQKVASLGKTCHYRGFKHWVYYFASSKEISTHPHAKPGFYLNKRLWQNKSYFLQHGVMRDISGYISKNYNFKLFVTSAYEEYKFIKENYGYKKDIIQLLGLPRHDNLINYSVNPNQILIMPTWRNYLINCSKTDFIKSNYYQTWNNLLNNSGLHNMLEAFDKTIIFYPHRNMQNFIHLFNSTSNRIKIADINNYDVQTLLKESALLITDYSSVFFDFAYMKKPVIWYLFDKQYYHGHHHKQGYFDENKNILGEYALTSNELINKLKFYITNDFKLNDSQIENINKFYPFFDGNNCKRVYNKIKEIK